MADRLTDDTTRHWTRHPHPLVSLIRIDGKTYRLMGAEPKDLPACRRSCSSWPAPRPSTTSKAANVELTFMTPSLPDNLDVLARPLTYVTWRVSVARRQAASGSIFFSAAANLAVHAPGQRSSGRASRRRLIGTLMPGRSTSPSSMPAGDDTRIDWGYVYLATAFEHDMLAIGSRHDLLATPS